MAIVTRTREPHNPEFVSAGDDYLKEYIKEIDRPKQQQSIPELPEDSDFTELEEMIPEVKEPSQYAQKRGKTTARFAVGTVDKIIASMVAVYAHSDSPKVFRADDEDIEDLAEQWGVYFTEANLDLPPWVFALITTGMVLMKKFNAATDMRKINIEKEKFRLENITLKNQVEKLTEEKKIEELKKQVESLRTGPTK